MLDRPAMDGKRLRPGTRQEQPSCRRRPRPGKRKLCFTRTAPVVRAWIFMRWSPIPGPRGSPSGCDADAGRTPSPAPAAAGAPGSAPKLAAWPRGTLCPLMRTRSSSASRSLARARSPGRLARWAAAARDRRSRAAVRVVRICRDVGAFHVVDLSAAGLKNPRRVRFQGRLHTRSAFGRCEPSAPGSTEPPAHRLPERASRRPYLRDQG